MSIVTFWGNGKEQTGKSLSMVAVATQMAIEHNYRILLISTGYRNETINRCFFLEQKKKKTNRGIFGPNTATVAQDGIEGLVRIMKSNKLSPETVTNYTKVVFKDERLEILPTYNGEISGYEDIKKMYPDIISLANNYYDLVLVDLDGEVDEYTQVEILKNSNVIVAHLSQRLTSIDEFIRIRQEKPILASKKVIIMIGRYDKFSKYTIKNISRYMGEKNKISTIPYNTLFFEAAECAGIPDMFLRLRKLSQDDRNNFFIGEVKRAAENIIYRLQDLQMNM